MHVVGRIKKEAIARPLSLNLDYPKNLTHLFTKHPFSTP